MKTNILKLRKVLLVFLTVAISSSAVKFFGNNSVGHKVYCQAQAANGATYINTLGFDETAFRVPGFDLKVFEKGGKIKLLYIDNKTGAQFIFDLTGVEDVKYNSIFFGCPAKDSSGKPHVLEHLLASPMFDTFLNKYKRLSSREFNGITNEFGFYFLINRSIFDLDNLKDIYKELKKPTFMSDDEKTFKKEVYSKYYKNDTGRLYNEVLTERNSDMNEISRAELLRKFDFGGKPEEVSKLSLQELKNFYAQYVHPSNMLCYFCCGTDPAKIKEVLNCIRENFLKYYEKANIQLGYRLNFDERNRFNIRVLNDCSEVFKSMNGKGVAEVYKYCANVHFDLNGFNLPEKDALFVKSLILECIESVRNEIESLGYSAAEIDTYGVLTGSLTIKLYGNIREKFENKQIIEDSAKKILNKFKEYLSALKADSNNWNSFSKYWLKSEQACKALSDQNIFNLNKFVGDEYFDNRRFEKFDKYRKMYNFYYLAYYAYVMHKDPFSDKVFQIKDGRIIDNEQHFKENFVNNIFNVFDKITNSGVLCVDVFEKGVDKKSCPNSSDEEAKDVKILIKNYKNNDVYRISEYILLNYILNPSLNKLGLSYRSLTESPYVGGMPQVVTNKSSLQSINNFLSKELNKKLNKFGLNKYSFYEIVKTYYRHLVENLNTFNVCLQYLRHYRQQLEQFRSRGACCYRQDVLSALNKIFNEVQHNIFFNDKQNFLNYKTNEEKFKNVFVEYFDKYLNNDDKCERFYAEILKYIDHRIGIFNNIILELQTRIENINSLKCSDVLNSIKSCKFSKD